MTQTLSGYLPRTFPQEPARLVAGSQRGAESLLMPKQIAAVSPAADSLSGLHTSGNPTPISLSPAWSTDLPHALFLHYLLHCFYCATCFVCTSSPPPPIKAREEEETLRRLDAGAQPAKHTIISAADPNELNVHSLSGLEAYRHLHTMHCAAVRRCLPVCACKATSESHECGNVQFFCS